MIVTLLTALTFLLLGTFRLGNLARFIPFPVVGGFLAGTGWLLLKGGIGVAAGTQVTFRKLAEHQDGAWHLSNWHLGQLSHNFLLSRWLPALVFGVLLLLVTRFSKR